MFNAQVRLITLQSQRKNVEELKSAAEEQLKTGNTQASNQTGNSVTPTCEDEQVDTTQLEDDTNLSKSEAKKLQAKIKVYDEMLDKLNDQIAELQEQMAEKIDSVQNRYFEN